MNNHIFEIIQDINGRAGLQWQEKDKQEFAELIVRECVNTIDPKTGTKWIKDQTQEEFWKNQSVHLIKEHFGVTE
jgi:hypothetical protein